MNVAAKDPLRDRFIAYFDVLGFSAIIENHRKLKSLANVIRWNLISSCKTAIELSGFYAKRPGEPLIRHVHFSDSVLYYSLGASKVDFTAMIRASIAFFVRAMKSGFPLRGCVTRGAMYVDDEQFLSKCLIEAYQLESQLEWAGIVLTKHCEEEVQDWKEFSELIKSRVLVSFYVPKKSGSVAKHIAVNWTSAFKKENNVRTCFSKKAGQKFDPSWEVRRKIENTVNFWQVQHSSTTAISKEDTGTTILSGKSL